MVTFKFITYLKGLICSNEIQNVIVNLVADVLKNEKFATSDVSSAEVKTSRSLLLVILHSDSYYNYPFHLQTLTNFYYKYSRYVWCNGYRAFH
jgi:hypothetical protein